MPDLSFLLLSAGDFLTGAGLTPKTPTLMWIWAGLILGGALAFWLEAPVYGLRSRRPLILAVPIALLLVIAVVVSLTMQPVISLAAPEAPRFDPPPPNFGGTWNTEWGAMNLTQDGDHVFGTYAYRDGVLEGTITPEGGNRFTLRYKWRNQTGGGAGVGYFTIEADAKSFKGQYADGDNLNGNGKDWSGKRTGEAPRPLSFTGAWDTEWGRMELKQGNTKVNGTYEYGGGLIEGDLNGKVLNFKWTNRVTGETGTGQFTLALYGQTFSGSWTHAGEDPGSAQVWTGKRIQ